GLRISPYQTAIKLWDRVTGETHQATEPVLHDREPAFDPDGKYLYFLGERELDPVYDQLHFDLGFPRGSRPYLVTLQADLRSPFSPDPHPLKDVFRLEPKPDEGGAPTEAPGAEAPAPIEGPPPTVPIDLEGIARRVVPFPVPDGIYGQIAGLKGKALFSSFPVEGALGRNWRSESEPPAKGTIEVFDFDTQRHEPLIPEITDFQVA